MADASSFHEVMLKIMLSKRSGRMSACREVRDFAANTSMHGVPRIIQAQSTSKKVTWSTVCLFAIVIFCIQLYYLCEWYFSYPTKVVIGLDRRPLLFPSITVCNKMTIDPYLFNQMTQMMHEDTSPISVINKTSNMFLKEFISYVEKLETLWLTYHSSNWTLSMKTIAMIDSIGQQTFSEAAMPLDAFVVNCFIGKDGRCNNTVDFFRIFDAKYRSCFTYAISDKEYRIFEGDENGLMMTLFTGSGMVGKVELLEELQKWPVDTELDLELPSSDGVRVVIHPRGTMPLPLTEGYDVPPGTMASFGIQSQHVKRISHPHGNCTSKNPFDGSRDKYRMVSCQKMCVQQYIIRQCHCKDSTLPDLPDTDVIGCSSINIIPDTCMYQASNQCLSALREIYDREQCVSQNRNVLLENPKIMEECGCYPPCEEEMYDVSYSLAKWPPSGAKGVVAYAYIMYSEQFSGRFIDPEKGDRSSLLLNITNHEKILQDFLQIKVYLKDGNVLLTEEVADYTVTQLLSDIGGQLGLWVGISVITLVELLALVGSLLRSK